MVSRTTPDIRSFLHVKTPRNHTATLAACLAVLGCLLPAPLLPAQEGDEPVELQTVFSIINLSGEPLTDLLYDDGAKERKLRLPPGSRSRFYAYEGPPLLQLYERVVGPDGVPQKQLRAATELRGEPLSMLLIGPADSRGRHPLRALPEDLEESGRPKIAIINRTANALVAQIKEERLRIPPGSLRLHTLSPASESPVAEAMLAIYRNDTWQLFFSTRWTLDEGNRRTVFVTNDTKGEPVVRYISEDERILRQMAEDARPDG